MSGCVRAPTVGRFICRPTKRLNLDDRRAMPRISPIDQSKPGLGPGVLLRGWGWRVGGRPYSRSIRMAFAICTHSYSLDTRLGMEAIMYESFAHSPGPPVHAADHSTIRDVGVLFLSTLCLHSAPNQAKNVRMHKFPQMTAYPLVYSNIFAWGPTFVLGVIQMAEHGSIISFDPPYIIACLPARSGHRCIHCIFRTAFWYKCFFNTSLQLRFM